MKVVISSGHGKKVRGASGYIDEVDEARLVVESVADFMRSAGHTVTTFHDDVSTSQSQNLDRIVDFHNSKSRDLDVSVHFNAYQTTSKPMGTEVLYVSGSGQEIADTVSAKIAEAGHFIDRGPKKRTDLAFLNGTHETAILVETCFVDSRADVDLYHEHFTGICAAIAEGIVGEEVEPVPPEPVPGPEGPWRENITATVFASGDDPQDSAYPPHAPIDGSKPGVSLPYKWRDAPPPRIRVQGPGGEQVAPIVDVGPWNTDDPAYVFEGHRPLAETQYEDQTEAQNGRVPTNDAAIDLTPGTASAIGISGKGKVRWKVETVAVPQPTLEERVAALELQVKDLDDRVGDLEEP